MKWNSKEAELYAKNLKMCIDHLLRSIDGVWRSHVNMMEETEYHKKQAAMKQGQDEERVKPGINLEETVAQILGLLDELSRLNQEIHRAERQMGCRKMGDKMEERVKNPVRTSLADNSQFSRSLLVQEKRTFENAYRINREEEQVTYCYPVITRRSPAVDEELLSGIRNEVYQHDIDFLLDMREKGGERCIDFEPAYDLGGWKLEGRER